MALNKETKADIVKKFQNKKNDTGASEVQIALLSLEIKELTNHLATNKKDIQAKRGLLFKVAKRKRLLNYLNRKNPEAYKKVIAELNIRG